MPILMKRKEWNRIVGWTNQDKEDPEVVRRREYVRYLDSKSREMTKNWPNSLENVNKRNEEVRRARIELAEQNNTKFYKRYVKRKKEEQQRLMHSARDTIFKNKDAPKFMLSAVLETVVQKERAEQLKFREEQRKHDAEQKRLEDDEIIRKAKEWNELMEHRQKKRFEANKQHQKEIVEQAQEIAEKNRAECEAELNMQKLDNMKAEEELDAIREFEENFHAEEKKRIFRDMEQSRQEAQRRAREAAARDELDDRLQDVLQKSRARTEATRKKTEKEFREEKLRILDKISQKLESGDAHRDQKEQAILEKAVKERNDLTEARAKATEDKLARFKQDRLDARDQFLRDQRQRLHELDTMRRWEMMNRFKNEELYEDFKEKMRKERACKIQRYRHDIIKLWEERDERDARALAETRHFYGELAEKKLRDADYKMLGHADALLEEARRHGRPDRPLRRALDRYCKLYRLYPMPPLPPSLKEHLPAYSPRDLSRPDPTHREPDTPPGTEHDGEDSAMEVGRRDGMQAVGRTIEKPVPPPPVPKSDYKRQGKANGLQRSRKEYDLMQGAGLPIAPCHTKDCSCDRKGK